MSTGNDKDTVRETVVSCIQAPRLKGVATHHFIEFKRLRDLYEKQLEEKSRQSKEELIPTSCKASIDNEDLEIFIAAEWIEAASVDEITERQVLQCIEERCIHKIEGDQLYLVDQAVKSVNMNMQITDATDRVWTFRRDYCNALRSAGYGNLHIQKPYIAIGHILRKLRPHQLYKRMRDLISWRKSENFEKENFDRFMREVSRQAEKLQNDQRTCLDYQGDKAINATKSEPGRFRSKARNDAHKHKTAHRNEAVRTHGIKRKRMDNELPLCLNPICKAKGERHFLSHCAITDSKTRAALLEDYRKAKKARVEAGSKGSGMVGKVTEAHAPEHSSAFRASFAEGKVETNVITDQGADANLMSKDLIEKIKLEMPDLQTTTLKPAQILKGVTGEPCVTCKWEVKLDVVLRIRHGSSLILRNIVWKVATEKVQTALIGRRVLESLGCDNREMLLAVKEKYGGDIDVTERLKQDGNDEVRCEKIAALFGESLFHNGGIAEDDGLQHEELYVDFGDDTQETIDQELEKRIDEAKESGLSQAGVIQLKESIRKHKQIFKLRLGTGGPAKIRPMKLELDPTKTPVRVKVRKYPNLQRKFLDQYFTQLLKLGFIKPCPQASWQAAPHLVPKDSKSMFRTTIDLRPVNAATKSEQWPMPIIEAELADFKDSKYFASLDFCAGYWQCPLDPKSYDACGIITPQGSFVSTRVLHGLKNAAAYFQSTIPPLFDKIRNSIKAWIDDFTVHAKTEKELIKHLDDFFRICDEHNLKLSAKKCRFFTKKVKWCGRIIDESGYHLDPRNIEAIQNMDNPINAAELCQFIHCCRWMSSAIPDFHRRMQPLNEILESAYKQTGKRRKSSLKNVALSKLSWGTRHNAALISIQDSLRQAVKLAFPKDDHAICVYTDASEEFWAGIVTQTAKDQLTKSVGEQKHEPMAFLGGRFAGAQRNWTTYEKEAYAIVQTFDRMDYLFWGPQPVHVFTDHRNLLYVFAPLALRPNSPRHVLAKVHRWAIHLSRFEFCINHIEGVNNVFADILTRWSKGYRTIAARSVAALYMDIDIVPSAQEANLVTREEVISEQQKYQHPNGAYENDEGMYAKGRQIWIPDDSCALKLRIMVNAHCGEKGHRAFDATLTLVTTSYWWTEVERDVREFTQSCIHCIVSRTGERIPRPLSNAMHGSKPNEVVHADFLYMGPAADGESKYILVIKDDLSSYTWLHTCSNADSEAATSALSRWIACFGSMEWLVTDQGPHFVATLMNTLTKETKISHHFTTPYCPWANGTIERLCREVLRITKALLSEWKLPVIQWPALVEVIQKIINHAPSPRLGRNKEGNTLSPMEVFTGLKPSPLMIRPMPLRKYKDSEALNEARVRELTNIVKLQEALDQMHKDVAKTNAARRTRAQRLHNARTNVLPVNFAIGDYAMIRAHARKHHKLQTKWRGPMRVKEAKSSLVFVVEDLVNSELLTVHAQRMIPYPMTSKDGRASETLRQQAIHYDATYHLVDKILEVRKQRQGYELKIRWMGLPDESDVTWEPLENIRNDLPGILEDFLHTPGNRSMKRDIIDLYY